MREHERPAEGGRAEDGRADAGPAREIDSFRLLAGATTVAIRHGGERYTLRLTRAGKLILTK